MAGYAAFYPIVSQLMNLTSASTASGPIQVSTGGFQGMKIDNLSTNNLYVSFTVSSSPALVLATTTGAVTGFMVGANVKNWVVTTPPNAWAQAMTTGATLTALLSLSAGIGID